MYIRELDFFPVNKFSFKFVNCSGLLNFWKFQIKFFLGAFQVVIHFFENVN